jgi:hypothetical protein
MTIERIALPKPSPDAPDAFMENDGADIFIVVDERRIAKRGRPGTPQAGTWVSLEPGWRVYSTPRHEEIVIEYNGVRVH